LPVLLRTSMALVCGGGVKLLFCSIPGEVILLVTTFMGCPVAFSQTLFWLFASALPDAPSKERIV